MSAVFSEGGEEFAMYRLRLDREIADEGIVAALVGVNPSTAGASANDQTIRKDIGFGQRLGWRKIIKVNKFAYRATDVSDLRKALDPIGPENDRYLAEAFADADVIIPCWGPLTKLPKGLRRRYIEVFRIAERSGKPVMSLALCNDGQPRHTCMLGYDAVSLSPWTPPRGQS
jgi:hypothetical protein